MHILLLNQFYPPDHAPTGLYLHDVGRELARRGHDVHVICSRRSYDGGGLYATRQDLDGVHVHRLSATGFGRQSFAGKLIDYASYYLLCAERRLHLPAADIVVSLTTPPYVGLLARIAGGRRVHWIMDLYPDVLLAHGSGLPIGPLRALTRLEFAGARRVITLGASMRDKATRYAPHASVIAQPLWYTDGVTPWLAATPNPLRVARGWLESELVLMYSGNMGLGHRMGEFLEGARRLGSNGPRWAFTGGGKRRAEVEAFARTNPEARVELHPYVPEPNLRASLAAADVHLVSLDSRWQGLMVPSKIQGIFAVGRPVIFVGGDKNEIATWIREAGAGWVVAENDIDALLRAVSQAGDPHERSRRGAAARAYAQTHFSPTVCIARMADVIESA